MNTPRNREELIDALGNTVAGRRIDPESIIEAIESLGLAIVPKIPTAEMEAAAVNAYHETVNVTATIAAAIAARPYAKERP